MQEVLCEFEASLVYIVSFRKAGSQDRVSVVGVFCVAWVSRRKRKKNEIFGSVWQQEGLALMD